MLPVYIELFVFLHGRLLATACQQNSFERFSICAFPFIFRRQPHITGAPVKDLVCAGIKY